jgi:hypothetical protein
MQQLRAVCLRIDYVRIMGAIHGAEPSAETTQLCATEHSTSHFKLFIHCRLVPDCTWRLTAEVPGFAALRSIADTMAFAVRSARTRREALSVPPSCVCVAAETAGMTRWHTAALAASEASATWRAA